MIKTDLILGRTKTIGISSDENKLKLAALVFDEIYSIDKRIEIPRQLLTSLPIETGAFRETVLSFRGPKGEDYTDIIPELLIPKHFKDHESISKNELITMLEQVSKEAIAKTFNIIAVEVARQVQSKKLIGIPLFNETILIDYLETDYAKSSLQDKVEVKLINAPVISAADITWPQIVEAKKDSDFNLKVRRFNIFINKNYENKDLQFVIDDLSLQIRDYENTCSKHGIKLVAETFKSLANSKSVFGTLGVAFCALVAKMPQYAILSAGVGAVLEVLNLYLTVRQYQNNFESFVNECPISLIFELGKLKEESAKSK